MYGSSKNAGGVIGGCHWKSPSYQEIFELLPPHKHEAAGQGDDEEIQCKTSTTRSLVSAASRSPHPARIQMHRGFLTLEQSGSALARRGRTRSTVVQLPAAARGAARGLAACDGSTPIMDYGRVSRTYARRVLQVCIICTSRRRALRRSRASRAAAVVSTYVAASSDLGRRAASRRSGERQGSVVGGGAKVGQAQADGELGSPCAPR